MSAWRMFFVRMTRRIWFRAALFTAAAVAIVLIGGLLGPVVPD
ncbi:DUF2254 domain-containing protein, partial [Schumannella sp. 10F1B-5-1]